MTEVLESAKHLRAGTHVEQRNQLVTELVKESDMVQSEEEQDEEYTGTGRKKKRKTARPAEKELSEEDEDVRGPDRILSKKLTVCIMRKWVNASVCYDLIETKYKFLLDELDPQRM